MKLKSVTNFIVAMPEFLSDLSALTERYRVVPVSGLTTTKGIFTRMILWKCGTTASKNSGTGNGPVRANVPIATCSVIAKEMACTYTMNPVS